MEKRVLHVWLFDISLFNQFYNLLVHSIELINFFLSIKHSTLVIKLLETKLTEIMTIMFGVLQAIQSLTCQYHNKLPVIIANKLISHLFG